MTARHRAWLLPPAALFLIAGILLGRGMASPLLPYRPIWRMIPSPGVRLKST